MLALEELQLTRNKIEAIEGLGEVCTGQDGPPKKEGGKPTKTFAFKGCPNLSVVEIGTNLLSALPTSRDGKDALGEGCPSVVTLDASSNGITTQVQRPAILSASRERAPLYFGAAGARAAGRAPVRREHTQAFNPCSTKTAERALHSAAPS